MTDYTKTTDFTSKDSLPSGDSGKIIRGAEFGTEFDNIETAVNSKSNIDNPTFTGTITGNGSGLTNVAAASIDLTVSSDTDADYNVPFMNATGDGGSAKVLQVDDNGLMFNPNSNTLSVNRLKGSNDNLLIQDTSGNTILDIDAGALEIPVNTTITGTTAVTGNITVTGTVDGRDVAADGTKLDTIETSADVTDTVNVTAAGALMDSELTSIASVKALNQGVATTDSPTFAGVTANGTVEFDGLSGTGAVTVTDILDQDDMSGNSATALATQQSIKAYVDSQVGTVDTLAEVLANGNATGGTDIAFGDNDKALFGAGNDLQIYHDGSNSFIDDTGTGSLVLQSNGAFTVIQNSSGVANARFDSAGAASIRYNGVEKLATTTTGIDVTGTVVSDGLTVNDAGTIQLTKNTTSAGDSLGIIEFHDEDGSASADAGKFQLQAFRGADKDSPEFKLIGSNSSGVLESLLVVNSTGIDVTGTATMDGLAVNTTNGSSVFEGTGISSVGIQFKTNASNRYLIQTPSASADLAFLAGGTTKSLNLGSNGDVQFFEDTGTTAKFHWDAADERLGIGTSSPSETLTVSGNIQIEDNDGYLQFKDTNGGTNNKFRRIYNSAQDLFISRRNDDGSLEANDLVINSSGNVGIGTDSPSDTLSVVNLGSSGTGVQISSGTAAGDLRFKARTESYNGILSVYDSGSNEDVRISAHSGVSTYFNSGSNVGIGTDSPALFSKLHVSSTTTALDAGGTIFASVTDAVAADIGGQVMMGGYYTGTTTAAFGGLAAKKENATTGNFGGYLQFLTSTNGSGNTEKMRITSDGLVGIGTDNPSTKLHVNAGTGNIAATFESTDAGSYINLIDSASGTYGAMIGASGDDIVFSPNNVEAMRIDDSQNLLVGCTALTPGNGNTDTGHLLKNDGRLFVSSASNSQFNRNSDGDIVTFRQSGDLVGSVGTQSGDVYISSSATGHGGLRFANGSILPLKNGVLNAGEIDLGQASGDLGFKDLYLSGAVNLGDTHSVNWGTGNERITGLNSSNSLRFVTGNVEACRIDSSQNLLVGTTDSNPTNNSDGTTGFVTRADGLTMVATNNSECAILNRQGTDGNLITFKKDGAATAVGVIGTSAGHLYVGAGGDTNLLFNDTANSIYPWDATSNDVQDGTVDLGASTARFKDIYATNGTIQTSDRNEKQDIEALSDAEQRVAVACKGLLRKFRWKSSVEENGDEARIHFGIIAQDLQDAFTAEGLDAGRYAMFISTTWTDEETGEDRTRMGVRYSELLAFIISAI